MILSRKFFGYRQIVWQSCRASKHVEFILVRGCNNGLLIKSGTDIIVNMYAKEMIIPT